MGLSLRWGIVAICGVLLRCIDANKIIESIRIALRLKYFYNHMEKDEEEQKPNYIHVYPFRFVQPYPHTYRTFAKARWLGR